MKKINRIIYILISIPNFPFLIIFTLYCTYTTYYRSNSKGIELESLKDDKSLNELIKSSLNTYYPVGATYIIAITFYALIFIRYVLPNL